MNEEDYEEHSSESDETPTSTEGEDDSSSEEEHCKFLRHNDILSLAKEVGKGQIRFDLFLGADDDLSEVADGDQDGADWTNVVNVDEIPR